MTDLEKIMEFEERGKKIFKELDDAFLEARKSIADYVKELETSVAARERKIKELETHLYPPMDENLIYEGDLPFGKEKK